jgi:hypothetical protein
MKTQLAFLLSTAAGLMTFSPVQAAPIRPQAITAAQSYAELLEPVQNATDVIIADDLAHANQPRRLLSLVQWHDHHHHHHHHHHHGFFPGFGITVGPRAYYGGDYYGDDCYIRRQVYINRWGERVVRRVRVCD